MKQKFTFNEIADCYYSPNNQDKYSIEELETILLLLRKVKNTKDFWENIHPKIKEFFFLSGYNENSTAYELRIFRSCVRNSIAERIKNLKKNT